MTIKPEVMAAIQNIHANREEILTAFVAKYGFDPELAEQVEQSHPDFIKTWHVRRMIQPDVAMKRTLIERAELAESRLAAAMKDARRYRWLRDHVQPFRTDNEEPHALIEVCIGLKYKHIVWFDLIDKTAHVGVVTLDQAIDTAIDAMHNSARKAGG